MKAKIFFICLIAAFAAQQAHAKGAAEIYLGAYTWHPAGAVPKRCIIGDHQSLNDHNRLVAVQAHHWIGGYFKNSYYHDTVFFGRVWRHHLARHLDLDLVAGADRGYKHCWPVTGFP